MYPILTISTTGKINRRDPVDRLGKGEVLNRENLMVIGSGNFKVNKKMPGSDRYNSAVYGSLFTSGYQYYSGEVSRTFAFENQNKRIISFDSLGNTTEQIHLPSDLPPVYPCWEEMKISDGNILSVADGKNGIYTYDGNLAGTFQVQAVVTLQPVDMVVYLDRLFVIEEDSDAVNYSKNFDFFNFTDATDAGVFLVGSKRGSKNMKLFTFNETLYIWKQDSLWVLEGRTPSEFQLREVIPNLGLASRRGFAKTNFGTFMFLASDFEVWACSGTQASLKCLSYNIALGGDFTKDLNPIIDRDHTEQICASYQNFKFRLAFGEYGSNQAGILQNNMEYIFDTTNETEYFTRGNNVSCYIIRDKSPDKQVLITGRSDAGYLMFQYRGLNLDNQAVGATMPIKLQTGFIRASDNIQNSRYRKLWGDFQVLGANDISVNYYLDTRLAKSSCKTVSLHSQGEKKSITNFVTIQNQKSITSRAILHWANSSGQSISLELDLNISNLDLSFSDFYTEVIQQERKRSEKVNV